MPTFALEDQDRVRLAEAIHDLVAYLPEEERGMHQTLAEELSSGETAFEEDPVSSVIALGEETWPARRAVRQYAKDEGAEDEWEQVIGFARPTTALLLKRLRKQSDARDLDGMLEHPSAAFAIHEEEEAELELLRNEIRKVLWQEHAETLAPYLEDAQKELEIIREKLASQEDSAEDAEWNTYVNASDPV